MYHVGTGDVRLLRDTHRYKHSLHFLYLCTVHSEAYLIYTHKLMHLYIYISIYIYINILFKKFKVYIKTLKTLLRVSILRSSSGSTHCFLLNLYIKSISDLLRYINFGDGAA